MKKRGRQEPPGRAVCGFSVGETAKGNPWASRSYVGNDDNTCEYRCAYGRVSERYGSLHLVAVIIPPGCKCLQSDVACCSHSRRTFNPKVAGSTPARPILTRACTRSRESRGTDSPSSRETRDVPAEERKSQGQTARRWRRSDRAVWNKRCRCQRPRPALRCKPPKVRPVDGWTQSSTTISCSPASRRRRAPRRCPTRPRRRRGRRA
jgi:hypothetical protein